MGLLRALLAGFFGCLVAVILARIPVAVIGGESVDLAVALAAVVLALAGAGGGALGAFEGRRAGLDPLGAWMLGAGGAIAYGALLSAGPGDVANTVVVLACLAAGALAGAGWVARGGRRRAPALRPRSITRA